MQTFILSLIQSITEFLPVSSSGHLIAFPLFFGWKEQGIAFDIALHLGTLLAVCMYFFHDLWKMLKSLFQGGKERKLIGLLIIATLPIALCGLLLGGYVHYLRQPYMICVMLIIFGVFLWLSDKFSKSSKTMEMMSLKDAFLIGLAQCLSLIPGTSRSGVTMTCARFCQIKRVDAARFSMLLSIPVIAAAGGWLIWKLIASGRLYLLDGLFFQGVFYSFLGGLFVIRFLMDFVKKHSFFAFMIYRIILGCFVFIYLWFR